MMIGYITIGANDSEASGKFYDAVLGACGHERKFADGGWIGYGPQGKDEHNIYLCPPYNKEPASFGNGMMIAFKAHSSRNRSMRRTRPASRMAAATRARPATARRRSRAGTAPICATPPATRLRSTARPDQRQNGVFEHVLSRARWRMWSRRPGRVATMCSRSPFDSSSNRLGVAAMMTPPRAGLRCCR